MSINLTSQQIANLALQLKVEMETLNGESAAQVHLLVTTLSRAFAVNINEVALYRLDDDHSVLKFLWPEKLKTVGAIPYSSFDSLAARTAREGIVLLENSFAARRHANAYEKIRLDSGMAAPPKPIQKIISSPVFKGDEVVGVIQLSRKGDDNGPHIQDFTDSDADALLTLSTVFGHFF